MSDNSPVLEKVATLSEACSMWKMSKNTIVWQHNKGYLDMRKSKGTWLVDLDSMENIYGPPFEPLIDELD